MSNEQYNNHSGIRHIREGVRLKQRTFITLMFSLFILAICTYTGHGKSSLSGLPHSNEGGSLHSNENLRDDNEFVGRMLMTIHCQYKNEDTQQFQTWLNAVRPELADMKSLVGNSDQYNIRINRRIIYHDKAEIAGLTSCCEEYTKKIIDTTKEFGLRGKPGAIIKIKASSDSDRSRCIFRLSVVTE
jgi:hypothetical protein